MRGMVFPLVFLSLLAICLPFSLLAGDDLGGLDDDLGDFDDFDGFDEPATSSSSPSTGVVRGEDFDLPPLPGAEEQGLPGLDPGELEPTIWVEEGSSAQIWRLVTAAFRIVGSRKRARVDLPYGPWERHLLRREIEARFETLVDEGGPGFRSLIFRRIAELGAYADAGGDPATGFPPLEQQIVRRSVTRVRLPDAFEEDLEGLGRDEDYVETMTAPLTRIDVLCPDLRRLLATPLTPARFHALLTEDGALASRVLAGEIRRGGGIESLRDFLSLISRRDPLLAHPVFAALGEAGALEDVSLLESLDGSPAFEKGAAEAQGRILGRFQGAKGAEALGAEARHELASLNDRLGLIMLQARKALQARDHFEVAVRFDPIATSYAEHLAVARLRCGDYLGARRDLAALMKRQPPTAAMYERYITATRHAGREEELLDWYDETVGKELDGACLLRLFEGLARERLLRGEWTRALRAIERTRAWALPRAMICSILVKAGDACMGLGKIERARLCYGRALEVESDSSRARHGLARVEQARGMAR